MTYIFKQKFTISELVPAVIKKNVVLIADPDIYMAKLTQKYLLEAGYEFGHCSDILLLEEFLKRARPTILLFNPQMCESLGACLEILKRTVLNYPGISIITIAHDISSEDLRQLMDVGIAGHVNRKLSRPVDVVHIIKTLMN